MMHTATETLKFKRLARRVRAMVACEAVSAETIAVGLLERLWHATAREARDGRIGAKFDVEDIAELIGWTGDAAALVDALVQERWLDRDGAGVLLVHDWDDHKPNWLRGLEGRRIRGAVCESELGQQPSYEPSNSPSSELGKRLGFEPGTLPPNQTKPNPTLPNETVPNQTQQINTAAASLPLAARFDFARLADTPEHREIVRLAAQKLARAAGKVLTREQIWEVAWIAEAVSRGFCSEMHDKLKKGGVSSYRRYVQRAFESELAKVGLTLADCAGYVPVCPEPVQVAV